ncbi:MAG TPA: hypothetical protein PKK06_18220 [Phycisphaerae bacterium]|nr:hypothetical protein [Phycisphaerae bacterium]HNU47148.1 hypothetical protein [Phycisphaerae bacterium]
MRQAYLAAAAVLAAGTAAFGAPLTPSIIGADINFGAEFQYSTNGALPDTLVSSADNGIGGEATAYWPNWPNVAGVTPIWYDLGVPGDFDYNFGGDLRLAVKLTGYDTAVPPLGVSLVGTGLHTSPGAADLEVWGYLSRTGFPDVANVLLWAIDLSHVSLYGSSDSLSYLLEGTGTIVGGAIAETKSLLGTEGVMRGNIDFAAGFAVADALHGLPSHYSPAADVLAIGSGSYSGETGPGHAVPEPAAAVLLAVGLALAAPRRRPSA